MAQQQLPNNRMNSDFRAAVRLLDNSVAVDWSSVVVQNVFMLAEAQDYAFAGGCAHRIDAADPTKLHITWPADKQMYEGVHRLVVQIQLAGASNTYDKRVVNVVPLSDSAQTVYDDDETDIEITVSEVDTSVMTEILRACQNATALANEAAQHQPTIINGFWHVYDIATHQYVNTGVKSTGEDGEDGEDGITPHIDEDSGNWFIGSVDTGIHAQGERGLSGNINFPKFEIDAAMHLQMLSTQASDADRFDIADDGHLKLIY